MQGLFKGFLNNTVIYSSIYSAIHVSGVCCIEVCGDRKCQIAGDSDLLHICSRYHTCFEGYSEEASWCEEDYVMRMMGICCYYFRVRVRH